VCGCEKIADVPDGVADRKCGDHAIQWLLLPCGEGVVSGRIDTKRAAVLARQVRKVFGEQPASAAACLMVLPVSWQ